MERNSAAGEQGRSTEQYQRLWASPASQFGDEAALRQLGYSFFTPRGAPLTGITFDPSESRPLAPPWRPGSAALGAGGTTSLEALRRADAAWLAMRTRTQWGPRPEFVLTEAEPLSVPADVDVAVCGGVLGIFLACTLQLRGGPAGLGGDAPLITPDTCSCPPIRRPCIQAAVRPARQEL